MHGKPQARPLIILSGFLGSGKTSMLRQLLADDRMARTAVIVNELGELGLDHLLLRQIQHDAVLLQSGCICCTLKSDFGETLKDLYRRQSLGETPPFDRIVVETTGLADPVPLLGDLLRDEQLVANFRCVGVVTTVDCSLDPNMSKVRMEWRRQIAVAEILVLTKTDLVGATVVNHVEEVLDSINQRAVRIDVHAYDAVRDAILGKHFGASEAPVLASRHAVHDPKPDPQIHHHDTKHHHLNHGPSIQTCCLVADKPVPWTSLVNFLREVARRYSNRTLRMKGLINVAESKRPIVIQGVQHFLYPETYLQEWPDDDPRSRIVFIFEQVEINEVVSLFRRFISESTPSLVRCELESGDIGR